jgi:hypothetical protein
VSLVRILAARKLPILVVVTNLLKPSVIDAPRYLPSPKMMGPCQRNRDSSLSRQKYARPPLGHGMTTSKWPDELVPLQVPRAEMAPIVP